jgi:hypothetical protein
MSSRCRLIGLNQPVIRTRDRFSRPDRPPILDCLVVTPPAWYGRGAPVPVVYRHQSGRANPMPGASYPGLSPVRYTAPVPWLACDDQRPGHMVRRWSAYGIPHARDRPPRGWRQVVTGAGKLSRTRCHLPGFRCTVCGTNLLSDAPTTHHLPWYSSCTSPWSTRHGKPHL